MKKIKLLGKTFYNSEFLDMENIQDINGTFLQNYLDYGMITTQGYPDLLIRKGSYGWVPSGFKDGKRHYEKYVFKRDWKFSENNGYHDSANIRYVMGFCFAPEGVDDLTDVVQWRCRCNQLDSSYFGTFDFSTHADVNSICLNYSTNTYDFGTSRNQRWKYTLPMFYALYDANKNVSIIPIEKINISYDCFNVREISTRGYAEPESLSYFGGVKPIINLHYTGNGLTFSGTPSIANGIVDFTKTNPITSSLKGSELNKYTVLKFINRVKFTKNSGDFVNLYGNDGIRVNAFKLDGNYMDYMPGGSSNYARLKTGFIVSNHMNQWVNVQTIINQKTGALEMSVSVEGGKTYKVSGNLKKTFPDQNIQIGRGINGFPFTQGFMDLSKSVIYGDGKIISPWVALY